MVAGPQRHPVRTIPWLLLLFLGLGIALRFWHFWVITHTPYHKLPSVLAETDMHAFLEWAQRIQAGDWAGRETYHPYFQWMQDMAPLETWYRWWGGKEIFHQAPLYPYLLAILLWVANQSLPFVFCVQLVIGTLQPLVMYGLGRRLFNEQTGLVAAAATACYSPFIFYEGTILRDWLPPILEPWTLLLLLRARDSQSPGPWVTAGAVFGLAVLTKETAFFFLPFIVIWLLFEYRRATGVAVQKAGLLFVGLVLLLSPLVARNLLVGAPALALSNRAAEGFIEGNAPDSYPVGLKWPYSMRDILERSNGRLLSVVEDTLARYEGDWDSLLALEWLKLRALVDPMEVPNNVSFTYGRDFSPPLQWTLRYGFVFPMGIAGLVLALGVWRSHLLLLLYSLAVFLALMSGNVLSRYRLVCVPVLILYGAFAAVSLWQAVRAKRWGKVAAVASLIAMTSLMQNQVLSIPGLRTNPSIVLNLSEFLAIPSLYASEGRYDLAIAETSRFREKAKEPPGFSSGVALAYLKEGLYRILWANTLLDHGEVEKAREQVRRAHAAWVSFFVLHHPADYLSSLPPDWNQPGHPTSLFELVTETTPMHPNDFEAVKRLMTRLGEMSS